MCGNVLTVLHIEKYDVLMLMHEIQKKGSSATQTSEGAQKGYSWAYRSYLLLYLSQDIILPSRWSLFAISGFYRFTYVSELRPNACLYLRVYNTCVILHFHFINPFHKLFDCINVSFLLSQSTTVLPLKFLFLALYRFTMSQPELSLPVSTISFVTLQSQHTAVIIYFIPFWILVSMTHDF